MQTTASFIDVTTAKKLTDTFIQEFCQRRSSEALELGPSYTRLWHSIESLLLAGGKRFRPYMVLATYQVYKPKAELSDILPAAAAQEFIHSAMLVHDDIIDRDFIRYGVANIAGQYDAYYKDIISNKTERAHLAMSAALLAGDALVADAHKILRKTPLASSLVNQAEDILNTAIFEVIGGELLDTEAAYVPSDTVNANMIARYKTASYSFVGPISTGAILAEAPEADITILREFAQELGIGYQLRDDILGTFGASEKTGKSTVSDIQEGKRTYLIEQFEKVANDAQKQQFFKLFKKADATDNELQIAKDILIQSGAYEIVEAEISRLRAEALLKIEKLTLPDESKKVFEKIAIYCLDREV